MKKSILIVEDEAISAMDIKDSLEESGYNVPAIATTGEEAITLSQKVKPDLILMDIVLHGELDGTQAAKRIVDTQEIPIVFLTAYNDEEHFNNAILASPYGYINKPIEIRSLQMAIEIALHKHKMQLESIAETNRIKNEFLANMTHEVRTPLNCIIGFAEMVCERDISFDISQIKEFMVDILSSSRNLMQLLNNILLFTEIESHDLPVNKQITDVKILIEETKKKLAEEISKKKLNIEYNLDHKLKSIWVDQDLLFQVFYNYLSNAVKYSHQNGNISVGVYIEKNNVLKIEVQDQGIGIGPEDQKNLFIPFKQLNMSANKEFAGAGLGLALTRRIVEALKGQVGFNSSKGHGSTFYATVPCEVKDTNNN